MKRNALGKRCQTWFSVLEIKFEPISFEIDVEQIEADLDQLGSRSVDKAGTLMRNTKRRTSFVGNHRPSLPGNPPAIDTGALLFSLNHETSYPFMEFGASVEYAGYLQDGTKKMAARPYLDVAIEGALREWPKFLENFIRLEEND